jgi:transposase
MRDQRTAAPSNCSGSFGRGARRPQLFYGLKGPRDDRPVALIGDSLPLNTTCLLRYKGLAYFVPRLKKIWADAAYRGKELAGWCRQQGGGWELEVVERQPGTRGFQVQPRRWVVERSLAWLSRNRRLAKDYERKVQISEMLIELAATRLLLRRLASHGQRA